MKLIERLFGVVWVNRVKLFLTNNFMTKLTKWYIHILTKWNTFEKYSLFLIPLINIFLFKWLLSFIIVLLIDFAFIKYVTNVKD